MGRVNQLPLPTPAELGSERHRGREIVVVVVVVVAVAVRVVVVPSTTTTNYRPYEREPNDIQVFPGLSRGDSVDFCLIKDEEKKRKIK